jgi:penicillin-binding protein 2
MMYLRGDNHSPTGSQFAFRVAVVSGIALVLFCVIFLRLWYLQVLSGDKYLEQAQNNRVRELRVPAPRGEILDRNGKVLVDNRTALALQLDPQELPKRGSAKRKQLIDRLAAASGIAEGEIEKQIRVQTKELPASPVTLQRDVGYPLVYYLEEHKGEFPGVTVERLFVRDYPRGELAAHVLGNVGEVTEDQLAEPRYAQLEPGDQVGKGGVEYQYDHLLRGQPGSVRLQVDALGRPRGGEVGAEEATAGNDLQLTIDKDVQSTGEQALASFGGLPGAFVAMDPRNGEVLGLGSYPTFDPTIFTRASLPPSVYKELSSNREDAPITDRAIQGAYPTGSTFKAITATAALEEGLISPDTIVQDNGVLKVDVIEFKNAGDKIFGPITMREALKVSSDVYFYKLGLEAEEKGGDLIQNWARQLGMGEPTGIDLPGESPGLVPTPAWRNALFAQAQDPASPGGEKVIPFKETDREWRGGDGINLSVGQGDLQSNPLQLAVAYSTIANGGDVVRPHVAESVEDASGQVIQEIRPAPRRHVDIDPTYQQTIMEGLNAAAMEPGGTSYKVFGNWKPEVAGKTGTAEGDPTEEDQSWYVAMAPYPDPKVVVAVTIENGVAHEGMIPSSDQAQEVEPPEWLDVEKEIYIQMPRHIEVLKDVKVIDLGHAKPHFILPEELPDD